MTERTLEDWADVPRREPETIRCHCGEALTLDSAWANTCDLCGREYNGSGQLLAPRALSRRRNAPATTKGGEMTQEQITRKEISRAAGLLYLALKRYSDGDECACQKQGQCAYCQSMPALATFEHLLDVGRRSREAKGGK